MQRLGQHFLKDKAAIKKIAAALELSPDDILIEVGPGHGELTKELKNQKSKCKIFAIEKDVRFMNLLRQKFAREKNIKIIEGDVLKILKDLRKSKILNSKSSYKLVGNIPYYITGHLLRIIGESKNKPTLCVLMLQKEVAHRLIARPPKMNRLAASVGFWAEPKILMTVPRRDFQPPPEVDSAIVKLKVKSEKLKVGVDEYYRMVRLLFAQPRKTILNNLNTKSYKGADRGHEKLLTKKEIAAKFKEIDLEPSLRPQDLSVEDIVKISKSF